MPRVREASHLGWERVATLASCSVVACVISRLLPFARVVGWSVTIATMWSSSSFVVVVVSPVVVIHSHQLSQAPNPQPAQEPKEPGNSNTKPPESLLSQNRAPTQTASKLKATSPLLAPPRQVARKLPVGQTARAARTHSSHLLLEMVIRAPDSASVGWRVKSALPTRPWVVCGEPWHLVASDPEMPSQIASSAAFWSWKTMCLFFLPALLVT